PFDLGSITITTTGFELIENSNGTVAVEYPDNMPIAIALTLPDDLFVTATLDYRTTGYRAQAAGDPENFTLDYTIENTALTLTDLSISNMPDYRITAFATVNNITGATTYMAGDMFSLSQHYTSDGMVMNGDFILDNLDNTGEVSNFSVTMDGTKFKSDLVLPATGINLMDLPAQLRAGLSFQSTSETRNNVSRNLVTVGGKVVSDQKTSAGNANDYFSFSQDGIKLDSVYTKYAVDYIMQELPFPIRLDLAKAGGVLVIPLLKSDKEQDFIYSLQLDEMTMGEEIWAQFDPTGGLPHDPASLTLDLSGKGKLFIDLLDFEAMQKVFNDGIKFGELTSVTVNNLDMSAMGASMTSTGAFTFDNSDLETYDGLPAPSGTTTFNIVGLNALMDKLIALDLLPDDAAMGIRMGLSLMTVAGDGEDTLVSDIQITPDGQITANGKRLK
ncbi:MAG: hypothetical protein KAT26_13470, partial [Marinosulfonomonas sp.]|nr:hypothetical protein [Marinosulfonomonas sp.]